MVTARIPGLSGERFSEPPRPVSDSPWHELVGRIQRNDASAIAELYGIVSKGARYYLLRTLGRQDAEDQLHDAFLAVLQPILRGELRDSKALMPFVFGVVRRRVAMQIGRNVRRRRREADWAAGLAAPARESSPEEMAGFEERRFQAAQILLQLTVRDREILVRFYVHEQTRDHICGQMGLTYTQFRLFKSRAIARVGNLWRRGATQAKPPVDRELTWAVVVSSSSAAPRTPLHPVG